MNNARIVILDKPFNHDVVITKICNMSQTTVIKNNFWRKIIRRPTSTIKLNFWSLENLYDERRTFDCQIELFDNELEVYQILKVKNVKLNGVMNPHYMYTGELVDMFDWEK